MWIRCTSSLATAGVAMAVLLGSAEATAQVAAAPQPDSAPAPYLGKWDVTGSIGWHLRQIDNVLYHVQDSSLYAGLAVGHYWTENLKTEVDVGNGGTARFAVVDTFAPGGLSQYYIYAYRSVSDLQVAVGQVYQFFHNAYFHPFVGAGGILHRERRTTERPAQVVPENADQYGMPVIFVSIPAATERHTAWRGDAFGLAGFKAYVSQRAFFRADLRVAGTERLQATNVRVGFGIDF
jgi:hypothetical protein